MIFQMPPAARVIAALHLPPFPGSGHPDAQSVAKIREFTLRNIDLAYKAGVRGLYLQDLGDHPVALRVQPHIIAGVSVVGEAIHRSFPDIFLGVCLMSHGAREPLAVAQAIGAQFVRLKVYVGAMIKAEGLIEGCAYEAIQSRRALDAEEIAILADVYDRTGEPLGRLPLDEEARQAAVYGRADGLVLTGRSFNESLEMVTEVQRSGQTLPIWIGGGVTSENVARALKHADGVIVSTAFKPVDGFTRDSLRADWDAGKLHTFMEQIAKDV
jgi:membrane complex biogenesis BtpA family protein